MPFGGQQGNHAPSASTPPSPPRSSRPAWALPGQRSNRPRLTLVPERPAPRFQSNWSTQSVCGDGPQSPPRHMSESQWLVFKTALDSINEASNIQNAPPSDQQGGRFFSILDSSRPAFQSESRFVSLFPLGEVSEYTGSADSSASTPPGANSRASPKTNVSQSPKATSKEKTAIIPSPVVPTSPMRRETNLTSRGRPLRRPSRESTHQESLPQKARSSRRLTLANQVTQNEAPDQVTARASVRTQKSPLEEKPKGLLGQGIQTDKVPTDSFSKGKRKDNLRKTAKSKPNKQLSKKKEQASVSFRKQKATSSLGTKKKPSLKQHAGPSVESMSLTKAKNYRNTQTLNSTQVIPLRRSLRLMSKGRISYPK
ncbi:hypothetical protein O181_032220 [Austropuccinia psidii MF-1]|uniref:Uncharacterized protein n=1 Tax=Austropuccinia psidii MF-1 TaxID=1389203 RepID=A0A9Q3H806_9BASI|nr:hypothetical protein [Austropuccinia psidii MF-1]